MILDFKQEDIDRYKYLIVKCRLRITREEELIKKYENKIKGLR